LPATGKRWRSLGAVLPRRRQRGEGLRVAWPAGTPEPGRDGRPASTLTRLKVWSFGDHSSPRQRQLAKSFVLFTLNPVNQRRLLLAGPGNLPVNRQVLVPTTSSNRFAAMSASLDNSTMLNFRNPDRVEERVGQLNDLLRQLIAGTLDAYGVLQGLSAPGAAPPDADTP
jgi:ABC-type glycerol-3-phosphate transport system substrate-binding protein